MVSRWYETELPCHLNLIVGRLQGKDVGTFPPSFSRCPDSRADSNNHR